MSRTSWKAKLFLICFGLGIGLVTTEVALHFLRSDKAGTEFENLDDLRRAMLRADKTTGKHSPTLADLIQPNADDRIIYDLRPNIDLTFQRAHVQTNSCGMRDIERKPARPAGVYRIALLGDSFAFGWGVEREQGFAAALESSLNRVAREQKKVEVLNFGVPGYSTFQEVNSFLEKGADFDVDEIVVYFIENDFGLPFYVRDIKEQGGFLAATEFARLTWQARDPEIEKQKVAMMGWDPNTSIRKLSNWAREQGVRLSILINPRKDWRKIRAQLPVLKKRKDIRVFNIRDQLLKIIEARKIEPTDLSLSFDPHPSALKHKLLAELVTPYFMDRL